MERGKLKVRDYQPMRMKLFNAYIRTMTALGKKRLDLNEEDLIQTARQRLGLHDFGDESFRRNMRLWLQTVKRLAYHPAGKLSAYKQTLNILESRLGAQAWFSKFPEILERQISAPIFIMGFARSGTTRLHRMLASDSRLAHLKGWEAAFPVPWKICVEAKKEGRPDPRIEAADKVFQNWSKNFGHIHSSSSMEPEEEVNFLMHGFLPMFGFVDENFAPFMNTSEVDAYEHMKRLLQLVSWWRGDDPSKPWVLKAPVHMSYLDFLLEVFPDARFIFIHRDPIKVTSSQTSLFWQYRAYDTDYMDPQKCGPGILRAMNFQCQKMMDVRENLIPKDRQIDILYADMNQDWGRVMAKIYEFIGLEYSEEARKAQNEWAESKNKNWKGAKYRLEDFGLDAKTVDEALGHYRERFNIPYEGARP